MSELQIMDADTAFAVAHQRVYAPVFFEKLATDFGLQPRNEAEAVEILQQAAVLRQAYDAEQEKSAHATTPLLQRSRAALAPLGGDTAAAEQTASNVKQAAAVSAADAEIAHAFLSLDYENVKATAKLEAAETA